MATDQQSIVIDIQANTTRATNEIQRLNRQMGVMDRTIARNNRAMSNSTRQIKTMGASFVTLSKHLTRLVVIYGSFQAITSTVKTFASFEQAIVNLGAISGVTGSKLKELEDKALELGKSTVFSASQVAEAMTEMARAGLSAGEQLAGIEAVLDLAVNGMVSLAEASEIATTAMNAFDLEAEDIPRIVDVMSKAINSSATNITQLGDALKKVAPVAEKMGVSLEETVATLGILADNGRRGAEAGTQLKIALLRLGANNEVKKYLKDLGEASGGMTTNMFNARGEALSLTERLTVLKNATAGLTDEMRMLHLTRIFGTEAIPSAMVMLDSIDEIKMKTEALNESFGYASINSAKMMDTLQGSYKELLSALQDLQINIGKQLNPALRDMVQNLTEFTKSISKEDIKKYTDAIIGLSNSMGELFDVVDAGVTVLTDMYKGLDKITGGNLLEIIALTAIFYKLSKSITGVNGTIVNLAKKLGFVAKPLAKIGVGLKVLMVTLGLVAVAVTGLMYAFTRMELWISRVNETTQKFTKVMDSVASGFEKAFTGADKLTQAQLSDEMKKIAKASKDADRAIKDLTQEIDKLEDKKKNNGWGLLGINQHEIDRLADLRSKVKLLESAKINAKIAYQKFYKQGMLNIEQIKAEDKALSNALATMSKAEMRDMLKGTSEEIGILTKAMSSLKSELDLLKVGEEDGVLTDKQTARLKALTAEYKELSVTKNKLVKIYAKATEIGRELVNNYGDEKEAVTKLITSHKARQVSLEKTLGSMKKKERDLANDLIAIDKEIANARKGHAQDRLAYSNDYQSNLKDLQASLLSDLGQYNNAQLRADEQLQLAKDSLSKGNLKSATMYFDEYKRLIKVNATEEIRVGDEVVRTKRAGVQELLKDEKASHAVGMQLLEATQQKELDGLNAKRALKVAEINMQRMQIKLQVESLTIMANMIEALTGVDYSGGLDSLKAEIAEGDAEIDRLLGKQRYLKIEGSVDRTELDTMLVDIETTKIKPKIDPDTAEGEVKFDTFIKRAEGSDIEIDVLARTAEMEHEIESLISRMEDEAIEAHIEANTTDAEKSYENLKDGIEKTPPKPEVDLQTRQAILKDKALNRKISQAVKKLVIVQYKEVGKPRGYNQGGLVMPRFAEGGYLDNGVGHSRKMGHLSGYGGGDTIKALLEKGEFIIRKEAVKSLGLARLNTLNRGRLPRFNQGGMVTPKLPRYAVGGAVSGGESSPSRTVELNLNMGGETYKMMTDDDVANALERYTRKNI